MAGGDKAGPATTAHESPFVGTAAEAQAVLARLSAEVPPPRLGRVVQGDTASCAHSGPVGGDWSARLAQARGGRVPAEDCGRTPRRRGIKRKTHAGSDSAAAQGGSDRETRGAQGLVFYDGDAAALGATTTSVVDTAPPRVHRRARLHEPVIVEDYMQESLVSCIRRSCGAASSLPMRRHEAPVTARVIGDPESRSRAIVLRLGAGKRDVSILWVSARGGVLCSCFAGTQKRHVPVGLRPQLEVLPHCRVLPGTSRVGGGSQAVSVEDAPPRRRGRLHRRPGLQLGHRLGCSLSLRLLHRFVQRGQCRTVHRPLLSPLPRPMWPRPSRSEQARAGRL